jgi:hypothetical protein
MLSDLEGLRPYWSAARTLPPLPSEYESHSAKAKQSTIWEGRILESEYDHLPPLKAIDLTGLFLTALSKKMDLLVDEAPPSWKKAIHAHGSVACITLSSLPGHRYTGLFQGANYGFIRVSVTANPADRGVAPGLALKLLVDQNPSSNVSALVSLTGQGRNYNLFANEYSNIVPFVLSPGPLLINSIFSRVTRYPTKLSLLNLAEFDQHGNPERNPLAPTQLFLRPNPEISFSEAPHDFRNDLHTLPENTLLFTVLAPLSDCLNEPNMPARRIRESAKPIAEIRITSRFVSSAYGDSQLFFRHQRFHNR